jgi:hypothetical protein
VDPDNDIKKLLDTLHTQSLALDYPQYESQLRSLGISYLVIAEMFDVDFYVRRVSMVIGATHLFCAWIAKYKMVYQKMRHGKARRAEGIVHKRQKENIPL